MSQSSKNTSQSLSVLRAAASQVAAEEQEVGVDGMLRAADEIANERGLSSPLRKSPERADSSHGGGGGGRSDYMQQENDSSRGNVIPRFSPRLADIDDHVAASVLQAKAQAQSRAQADAEEDTFALMREMKIEPKVSATVGFADDVQALLDHVAVSKGPPLAATEPIPISRPPRPANAATTTSVSSSSSSAVRERYKKRLEQSLHNKSLQSLGHASHSASLYSEPAEVALRLSLADDRPYADHIRRAFRNEIEETLFRSTFVIHKSGSSVSSEKTRKSKQEYQKMRKTADRLSAPAQKEPSAWERKADKTLRYSTFEEAKECTFRPRLNGRKNERRDRNDDEAKEDPKSSFISRQEAEERNRREELTFMMGKQNYDAKVDKKICPRCGAKQSYDEVREKRKICPNCNVEYCNALTWAKVRNRFWKKCNDYAKRVNQHREEILQQIEDDFLYTVKKVVNEEGKVVEIKTPRRRVLTSFEEEEFFERIESKLALKKERLQQLEKEIYEEKCTFHPSVKEYKDPSRYEEDDLSTYSDDDKNVVQAFLTRYEEDMAHRREVMPQRYMPLGSARKAWEEEIAPFKV
eukprot:gene3743-4092_t